MTPHLLLIAGAALFVLALALPAWDGGGFLRIRGPGWRVLGLSVLLGTLGFFAMVREGHPRAPLCLLPLAANVGMIVLGGLGIAGIRGSAAQLAGVLTLMCLTTIATILALRCRDSWRIGTICWIASGVLLALHGISA